MSNLENKIKKLTVFGATLGLMFLANCNNNTSNQTPSNNQVNRTGTRKENPSSGDIHPEVLSQVRRDINIGMGNYRGAGYEYAGDPLAHTGRLYDDEGRVYDWWIAECNSHVGDSIFSYTLVIEDKRTYIDKKYTITINSNQKMVTDLRSR
jgi:hypothetical protein